MAWVRFLKTLKNHQAMVKGPTRLFCRHGPGVGPRWQNSLATPSDWRWGNVWHLQYQLMGQLMDDLKLPFAAVRHHAVGVVHRWGCHIREKLFSAMISLKEFFHYVKFYIFWIGINFNFCIPNITLFQAPKKSCCRREVCVLILWEQKTKITLVVNYCTVI